MNEVRLLKSRQAGHIIGEYRQVDIVWIKRDPHFGSVMFVSGLPEDPFFLG